MELFFNQMSLDGIRGFIDCMENKGEFGFSSPSVSECFLKINTNNLTLLEKTSLKNAAQDELKIRLG